MRWTVLALLAGLVGVAGAGCRSPETPGELPAEEPLPPGRAPPAAPPPAEGVPEAPPSAEGTPAAPEEPGGPVAAEPLDLPPPPPQVEAPEDRMLAEAADDLRAARYAEALRIATEVLATYPVSPSRPVALDYLGEALFRLDRFAEADANFQEILAEHPDYPDVGRVIRRRYQIGAAMLQGHRGPGSSEERGAEILTFLLDRFTGEEFDRGRLLIGDYRFREGSYAEARAEYERLLTEFPASIWTQSAEYRVALTYIRESHGVDYDPVPLCEAERRLRTYVAEHPSGAHIDQARATLEQLTNALARRDLDIARHYLRVDDRPRAAVVYLASVVRERPDSEAAPEARTLLQELAGSTDADAAEAAREALAETGP